VSKSKAAKLKAKMSEVGGDTDFYVWQEQRAIRIKQRASRNALRRVRTRKHIIANGGAGIAPVIYYPTRSILSLPTIK
jgi:hypothetical protein